MRPSSAGQILLKAGLCPMRDKGRHLPCPDMSVDRDCESEVVFARRRVVRAGSSGVLALGAGLACGPSAASGARTGEAAVRRPRPAGPRRAWGELEAGNRHWRAFHASHPDRAGHVRRALVVGQHPFAVVLGCVDSRVPPELVFDQGLGDLLTVRSAGEVLDEAVLGSLAYGVLELGVPLIVVLGHQGCGAVAAAVHAAPASGRSPDRRGGHRERPPGPGTPCRRAGPRPGCRRLPGRSRRPLRADQPVGAQGALTSLGR